MCICIVRLELSIFLMCKSQKKKQKTNSKHGSDLVCLIIQVLKDNCSNTLMTDISIDEHADMLWLNIRYCLLPHVFSLWSWSFCKSVTISWLRSCLSDIPSSHGKMAAWWAGRMTLGMKTCFSLLQANFS